MIASNKTARVVSHGLEEELITIAGRTRNGRISARYFGLDGHGGTSLQSVGNEHGITRERVRQIVSVVAETISQNKPAAPCLDAVISFALRKTPIRASECEDAFRAAGLTSKHFRIEGVLKAAELLGKTSPFLLNGDTDRTVLGVTSADDFFSVVRAAQQEVASWGMTTVERVVASAQRSDRARRYDIEFVERALACRDNLRWLDRKAGWFWLSGLGRNRVLNRAWKILAVTNPIAVDDLLTGLTRHHRMQGFAPPCTVLVEFCRQIPGLKVENGLVFAEKPIDPGKTLSSAEQTMFRIFTESGGKMTRAEVTSRCAEQGMNQLTVEQYLVYSPILSRYGGGRYGLVGSE